MKRLRVALCRWRVRGWLAVHYRSYVVTEFADRRVGTAYDRLVDREAA